MSSPTRNYDLIVFTAPSGAGKTTIVRHLLKKYSDKLSFSISATTRRKRDNETDGKDYYFLDNKTFKEKAKEGLFLEWEEVYKDKLYGTLHSEINRILQSGKMVIFDIEVNGAQSIKDKYGDKALVIFVKPPSFRTLIARLQNRKTETPDSFKKRVMRIKKELLFENSFDLVLLNDILEDTLKNAEELFEKKVLKDK